MKLTQNIVTLPFNYNNITQDKKKAHKALVDENKAVLMMGKTGINMRKARRHEGAQFSRLDKS